MLWFQFYIPVVVIVAVLTWSKHKQPLESPHCNFSGVKELVAWTQFPTWLKCCDQDTVYIHRQQRAATHWQRNEGWQRGSGQTFCFHCIHLFYIFVYIYILILFDFNIISFWRPKTHSPSISIHLSISLCLFVSHTHTLSALMFLYNM